MSTSRQLAAPPSISYQYQLLCERCRGPVIYSHNTDVTAHGSTLVRISLHSPLCYHISSRTRRVRARARAYDSRANSGENRQELRGGVVNPKTRYNENYEASTWRRWTMLDVGYCKRIVARRCGRSHSVFGRALCSVSFRVHIVLTVCLM